MSKPREFWIEISVLSNFVGAEIYRVLTEPQTELEKRTSLGCIHVREVLPIDWERVFKIYRRWFRLYKAKWHLVSIVETDDMLKQIVERSMRGE